MGNSDPCENGPNCWFLWNSDCWYKHPYEEKKKVLEMKREARRAFEEKKRAEENEIAEEAFTRIPALPEELKMHILHHLSATIIEKLELPISTLRAVLQVHISHFFVTSNLQGWTILQPTDCQIFKYVAGKGADRESGAGEVDVDAQGGLQRRVARPHPARREG